MAKKIFINNINTALHRRVQSAVVNFQKDAGKIAISGLGGADDNASQYFEKDKNSQYKRYLSKFDSFLRVFKQIFVTIESEPKYFMTLKLIE